MKIISRILVLFLIFAISGCVSHNSMSIDGTITFFSFSKTKKTQFNYVSFTTKKEKRLGLSNIDSIDENTLALFPLDEDDQSVWMKDMNFPLDLLFFDDENRLISIMYNLSPCNSEEKCTQFNIPRNAKWLIEINSGVTNKANILLGDKFSL